jgi:hypothetical protein
MNVKTFELTFPNTPKIEIRELFIGVDAPICSVTGVPFDVYINVTYTPRYVDPCFQIIELVSWRIVLKQILDRPTTTEEIAIAVATELNGLQVAAYNVEVSGESNVHGLIAITIGRYW